MYNGLVYCSDTLEDAMRDYEERTKKFTNVVINDGSIYLGIHYDFFAIGVEEVDKETHEKKSIICQYIGESDHIINSGLQTK